MRSMDSILADEPSLHALPDEPKSESSGQPEADQQASTDKPDEPEKASAPEAERADDEDDALAGIDPGDLRYAGLKKVVTKERKFREAAEQKQRELQRQYDQAVGRLQALERQQQPAQQQQPKTEDEYEKFLAEGPKWTRGLVDQQVSQVREQLTRRQIEILQADFEDRHEDARDLLGKFSGLAQNDPSLAARFTAIVDGRDPAYRNPVRFAYDYAKAYAQAAELADPVAYREKVKAEVLAELGKSGPSASPQPPAKAPPKTLAGARGTGAGVTQEWRGPRSMAEILK